jgi:site-specific DNA-methyltransferase (adenine-specific)
MIGKRQKQIFDYVVSFKNKNSFAPSLSEIKKHIKLNSSSTIHYHLKKLQDGGYLQRGYNKARAIDFPAPERMMHVPLHGLIAAGAPIEAIEQKESIVVAQSKLPFGGEYYALRVVGDSMIDENINDGDVVLVKSQNTAENGQKVVALVDNQEATLKKFYKERGQIRLQPANPSLKPLIFRGERNVAIQGLVIDVIHEGASPGYLTDSFLPVAYEKKGGQRLDPYYDKPKFKLYNGDCLKVLAEMPENSVDMIFADPPYNLSNGGFSVHAGRMVSVNKGGWDKSKGFKDDYNFHYKWLEACKRILKPHGTLWVSGTYHSIYQCGHALQALGYHILNDVAWFKPNASPNLSCRFFTASHETLIWARKDKKAKHVFNYKAMKDGDWSDDFIKKAGKQMRSVWAIGTPKAIEKKFGKHPTQKPEDLLKRIILASTNNGAVVVDPFTGSSTTGIAAHLFGRDFIGIDTDKKYLDLSIKRFEELEKSK